MKWWTQNGLDGLLGAPYRVATPRDEGTWVRRGGHGVNPGYRRELAVVGCQKTHKGR